MFYAAITLEGKLGSAYEPIIFAALNSAKVMLAVGTKPEYFQAVWVKNEWSRFLKMNKDNRNKMLIPCYKGMDPYDLPDEFAHLQAQDMGKIGFITDLIRGVKKVMEKSVDGGTSVANVARNNVQIMLKRAQLSIEDGEYDKAQEYADKVLDIDPECADAYFIAFLCDMRIPSLEKMDKMDDRIAERPSYKKLVRFATGRLKEKIIEHIAKRYYAYAEGMLEDIIEEQHYKTVKRYLEYASEYLPAQQLLANLKAKREELVVEKVRGYLQKGETIDEAEKEIEKLQTDALKTQIYQELETAKQELLPKLKKEIIEKRRFFELCKKRFFVSSEHFVGVKSDGTVIAVGENKDGKCNVSEWRDIVAVAGSRCHTVGLKADGTVVAVGSNNYRTCNVEGWKDVVAISASTTQTVGLKSDGTVLITGTNEYGQGNISWWNDIVLKWDNIVAIHAMSKNTVGLKADGTVVVAGRDEDGQCNVSHWRNIVAIAVGAYHIVGLKADGTVVASGHNNQKQCEVDDWKNIVFVTAYPGYTLGVMEDGKAILSCEEKTIYLPLISESVPNNTDGWKNIVAADKCWGLQFDGQAINLQGHRYGENLVAINAPGGDILDGFIGVKSDGTLCGYGKSLKIVKNHLKTIKLFDNICSLEEELAQTEKRRVELVKEQRQKQMALWRAQKVCQYCGGKFKGLFKKVCTCCGTQKDY